MFTLKYIVQLVAFICIIVFAIKGDYWWSAITFMVTVTLDHIIDITIFKNGAKKR